MEGAVPGATYILTFDVLGNVVNANGEKTSFGADLHLRSGTNIKEALSVGTDAYTDTEWATASIEFTMPEGSDNIRLRPGFAWRSGTAYVDNVKLTMIAAPEGYEPPVVEPEEP